MLDYDDKKSVLDFADQLRELAEMTRAENENKRIRNLAQKENWSPMQHELLSIIANSFKATSEALVAYSFTTGEN